MENEIGSYLGLAEGRDMGNRDDFVLIIIFFLF